MFYKGLAIRSHCIRHTIIFSTGECENRIDTLRSRLRTQSETIRVRNEEKKRLNEEARRLRAEADSACLRY